MREHPLIMNMLLRQALVLGDLRRQSVVLRTESQALRLRAAALRQRARGARAAMAPYGSMIADLRRTLSE